MINTRQQRLEDLLEELSIIRSFYERFWSDMSEQQLDYLSDIEYRVVKEIRVLEK